MLTGTCIDIYFLFYLGILTWTKHFNVEFLEAYIKRTAPLKKGTKQLLICYKAPHGPVSKDTILRWIEEAMKAAVIDTTVLKPIVRGVQPPLQLKLLMFPFKRS